MAFQLPKLAYPYDALEPYIDARTMEIHHTKHHAAYTDNLNKLLKEAGIEADDAARFLADLAPLPESIRAGVRNNGGGFVNHNLFWEIMGPKSGGEPDGELAGAIGKKFGSFTAFKEKFADAAVKRFGSGWAWLSVEAGELVIGSTPNQDNPVTDGLTPILGLDVWEHAYYLKYQNRRAEYISNWWNVVHWKTVAQKYAAAMAKATVGRH